MEDFRRNVNTTGPRFCCDEGKRILETLGYIFRTQFCLDVGIVRIFNTYGPYMHIDDGRVVTAFIKNLLKDKPLEIFGDSTQTRSLCYVSDFVEGLSSYLFSNSHKIINFGNDREVSVSGLAEIICKIAQKKTLIINKPLSQDDSFRRCPDLSRAKKHLIWKPQIELETGLKLTYEFFNKKYDISR